MLQFARAFGRYPAATMLLCKQHRTLVTVLEATEENGWRKGKATMKATSLNAESNLKCAAYCRAHGAIRVLLSQQNALLS